MHFLILLLLLCILGCIVFVTVKVLYYKKRILEIRDEVAALKLSGAIDNANYLSAKLDSISSITSKWNALCDNDLVKKTGIC